ncbi:MAG TPA: Na+/H+ antiporter NhaA [Bacteroidales bacterium]|nr:Na+/H+ antiporter NhaA [Bacteroidales bacterium]
MKITHLYKEFFNSEKAGGLILIVCTAVSLILANSGIAAQYLHFWHTDIAGQSLTHWINDGLMTLFFLLIGLELEREIYEGELSNIKDALLPIFAAIGGMIVPAGIYYLFNYHYATLSGAGIPTATDIAFALGVLSLLGNRVPTSLKIFLTALAVIDDLGAIIVISVFYTHGFAASYLFLSLGVFAVLLVLNRLNVKNLLVYLAGGVVMWYFMMHSGVHPTISGVLLAFVIPFREIGKSSPSYVLQHLLHKPVAFIILPVFALANTAIALESGLAETLTSHYGLGISLGLIVGKPLGIFLLSLITVSLGITKLPGDVNWKSVAGVGFLGGIGFTMSIFITLLAFDSEVIINNAKLVILLSSLVAGIIGYFILKLSLKEEPSNEE